MSADFINYTFGRLVEDIKRIIQAGVLSVVNEMLEKKVAEIEEIKNRIEEIERILKTQKDSVQEIEKRDDSKDLREERIEGVRSKCNFEGCEKDAFARGYCKNHYYQLKRKGLLKNLNRDADKKVCAVEGCDKKAISKGLCKNHYYQFKRGTLIFENGKYIKKA